MNADDDSMQAEVLDRLVAAIQSGDQTRYCELLQQHPDLRDLAACLEDLESLAPRSAPPPADDDLPVTEITPPGRRATGDAPPRTADSPVADFGKYELMEEVGRGGMAVVYKARQKDLDRIVAIKMILSSRLASRDEVRRFYVEARAAGRLQHPNIVGIHEVGEVLGQHFIAMDFIDGPSLDVVLRHGIGTSDGATGDATAGSERVKEPVAELARVQRSDAKSEVSRLQLPNRRSESADGRTVHAMDFEASVRCLLAVARAVEYLHSQNVVHRDLKPSNILIDRTGQPRVTDFGLAKVFEGDSQLTQSGAIVGTPSYMAPEQAAGRTADVSARSDVYSLGAILYEMLTRRPPFRESNSLDTLMQVLEGEPALPRQLNPIVPAELEVICLRCLEKKPERRYQSAAELAADLDRFLTGEPIEARALGIRQRLRRWIRREPALVGRLIAFAAAAAIVQTVFVWDKPDWNYHVKIMSIFGVWAIVSVVLQKLMNVERLTNVIRFVWAAGDVVLLTTLLATAHGPRGSLLIGYPALVAASGLFFRVRLVTFTTVASLIGYAALLRLRPEEAGPTHYPVIFAALLAVVGFIVGYQVYRLRLLSRYFEHRN